MDKQPKTEIEQLMFFNQCLQRFKKVEESTGSIKQYYDIAGTTVCLNFAGIALLPYLTPALEHLKITKPANVELTINVWDTESTNVEMIPPPCTINEYTDRGDIWGFNSKRIKTAFHWSEYSVNVMDLNTNTGVYWVKTPKAFPYWVYSSPFRSMIQWWMEKNGGQLLHAAAVGTENGAVLITGKGGVGKSTTAIISLNVGMNYLGDDYVIVKKDPEPKVYSLYSTAKLNMEDMHRFQSLERFAGEPLSENQEKAVLFLYPGLKKQIKKEMPLRAIFTPQIKSQLHTIISPISFWPVQRAMSFTTMSQLPGVGSHTHEFISELTRSLPCYTIGLGSDFNLIPDAINNFLNGPKEYAGKSSVINTNNEKPLISVIIPVYNGDKFILEAISNIFSQNYPALEIIIVDDGSTDNSKIIIENLDIDVRYFYQPNDGPASARNRGIKDVSGEFIAFLDVDDLWPENNLILLLNEMQNDSDVDVVRGHAQLFKNNDDGSVEFVGNPDESFPNYIGAGLYRKLAFSKVGLFDDELTFGEDEDWYTRAKELKLKMKRLDEVTLYVRRHGGNMTEGKSLVELNKLKVFKKALDRERANSKNND